MSVPVPASPGAVLTAAGWNQLQVAFRRRLVDHRHLEQADGLRLEGWDLCGDLEVATLDCTEDMVVADRSLEDWIITARDRALADLRPELDQRLDRSGRHLVGGLQVRQGEVERDLSVGGHLEVGGKISGGRRTARMLHCDTGLLDFRVEVRSLLWVLVGTPYVAPLTLQLVGDGRPALALPCPALRWENSGGGTTPSTRPGEEARSIQVELPAGHWNLVWRSPESLPATLPPLHILLLPV